MDRSIADGCPLEGFILVGWPLFNIIRLSFESSSSIILPL